MSPAGRPSSLMDNHNQNVLHVVQVVVNKDERGYGMKVSGDNPVYVQSVKEGKFIRSFYCFSVRNLKGSR